MVILILLPLISLAQDWDPEQAVELGEIKNLYDNEAVRNSLNQDRRNYVLVQQGRDTIKWRIEYVKINKRP